MASMTTPAELGLSHTSSFSSTFSGTSPKVVPSMRMWHHLRSANQGTWSDGPTCTSEPANSDSSWLVTAWVLEIFLDSSRSRSSMFRKSVLPPKLSW